ncbi:flagellar motor protein MotB [Tenacibaculum todarodis]|uniref:Flagellar motor protein MotB n=2 Tax=Tenacibaculum TaxID=104267 RepID=A0A1L3JL19_9FLAO|nr:OmpA family protein [Tenacibaculum todarodis]APG65793.1 flagellar motor protein MotB [Tenacibaculum todarodis]
MSKKTSYLLGILLTIIVGTFLYWKLCCSACCGGKTCKLNKEKVDSDSVTPDKKAATLWPFSIKDANGDLSFSTKDNFKFNSSNFKILDSVSSSINDGILNVKEYLDANGKKRFNITGYYTSDEKNPSAFPNLGLARANSVKNHMVSKGISSKLINTFGKLNDEMAPDANGIFHGPLGFDIFTRSEDSSSSDEALAKACEAIKANPLVLHFNTGQASINLTAEQRQKIADISRCVDKLGAKVQVVGHTDNTGNADNNMVLGQNRADFAKKYLVNNGILSNNINATSKGPNEPIADNATDEGKAKNRRTVVTIN